MIGRKPMLSTAALATARSSRALRAPVDNISVKNHSQNRGKLE